MIVERLRTILLELTQAEIDAEKCEDGNASAGRRLRKISMTAIKDLKELRAMILEQSK